MWLRIVSTLSGAWKSLEWDDSRCVFDPAIDGKAGRGVEVVGRHALRVPDDAGEGR
jgi:hypothetical protein